MDVITDIALREVKKNDEFTFSGIGKLVKQKRKARMGHNPATGEKIKIAAKTVVKSGWRRRRRRRRWGSIVLIRASLPVH